MSNFHGVLYIKPFPAHQQVMREIGKIHGANLEGEGRNQQKENWQIFKEKTFFAFKITK